MWNEETVTDYNVTSGGFDANATAYGSPSTTSTDGKQSRQPNSLFPVNIKQIKENKEDPMTISGYPVSMMTLVGIVVKIEVKSTKIVYTIRDWSGSILGMMWLEGEDDDQNATRVTENTYCRITGTRRIQDGEPCIFIYNISPIVDMSEITYHYLQVMYIPFKAEEMSHNPLIETESVTSTDLTQPISIDHAVPNDGLSLTPHQRLVYGVLKSSCSNETGLTKKDIFEALRGRISFVEIDKAMDFLTSEGHVYATIDDDHFRVTDS